MKRPSLPFLIILFVASALVHKGLAKKSAPSTTEKPLPNKTITSSTYAQPQPHKNILFSIHKIVSSTISYELHLEMNGALETWKIPKGPSCNPLQQRQALKKENLPLPYLLFEGALTKEKNYKEGIVVWDHGTYTLAKESDAHTYIITFNGSRIKGLYTLRKRASDWVLCKEDDEFADTHKNITRLFTKSALSGLTLTQILHRSPHK